MNRWRVLGLVAVGSVTIGAAILVASHTTDASSTQPPAQVLDSRPFRCPDPRAVDLQTRNLTSLPNGATAAVICRHDNHISWVPPREPLTTGLDGLVSVVNSQEVHDPTSHDGCGGVGAPAWTMVFRYRSGTRTISGDNGGCWDLRVGSTERFGSRHVYDAYLRALLLQRHRQGSPDVAYPRPTCPDHVRSDDAFSPLADAGHLTSAVLCPVHGTRVTGLVRLTRAQLAALHHEFATATTRRTGADLIDRCGAPSPGADAAIVGRDAWGEPVTVLVECGAYRTVLPGHERYLFARMLPTTMRLVDHLLGS